jgi:hypothetical protein
MSDALEMTTNFYYPTLELFGFSFTQPFTHLKFCLLNHFLFGAIPNHRPDDLDTRKSTGTSCQIEIHFMIKTTEYLL